MTETVPVHGPGGELITTAEITADADGITARFRYPAAPIDMAALSAPDLDTMLEDLRDLLEALGLGGHARPQSPHEVMQMAIAEVRRLRAAVGPP